MRGDGGGGGRDVVLTCTGLLEGVWVGAEVAGWRIEGGRVVGSGATVEEALARASNLDTSNTGTVAVLDCAVGRLRLMGLACESSCAYKHMYSTNACVQRSTRMARS